MKRTAALTVFSIVTLVACGAGATVQEQAGDAVAEFVNDDDDLSDADFDTACVRRTALGLTDEVAQGIVDRDGRVDLDVNEDDRDDVYDFYNCADDRDLARLIERESGTVDADCLELAFDEADPGDFLSDADGDRAGRLGDFDQVSTCSASTPVDSVVDSTVPETTVPETTVPETTVPPTTAPPETTTTTTTTTTTVPPTTTPPAMEEAPRPMSDPNSGAQGFADDAEIFLNDDPIVSDAVGGDVESTFCLAPSNANVGTRFLCFGAATGFGSIEFEVEITEVSAYLVQDFRESLSADRLVVFIILDAAFVSEELPYDQICVRNFLASVPDDQVGDIFDENTQMNSVDGLAPCLL